MKAGGAVHAISARLSAESAFIGSVTVTCDVCF